MHCASPLMWHIFADYHQSAQGIITSKILNLGVTADLRYELTAGEAKCALPRTTYSVRSTRNVLGSTKLLTRERVEI